MWFEIPQEHADLPEAKRIRKLHAEFARVLEEERRAIQGSPRDLAALEQLGRRSSMLRQDLRDAVAAYDKATGEPQPIALSDAALRQIEREFAPAEVSEVIGTLSKMQGRLKRQGVLDQRVVPYVLALARGDRKMVRHNADAAVADFRDIIYCVECPDESRLNTEDKIKEHQDLLRWMGLQQEEDLNNRATGDGEKHINDS